MPTEAQKRASAKWNAAHMVTLGVKMRRELAIEFAALAERNGTTRNAVLLQAVRDYVEAHRQDGQDPGPAPADRPQGQAPEETPPPGQP